MSALLGLDQELFLRLHYGMQADWLTPVMIFFSQGMKWLPVRIVALLFWLYLVWRGGRARLFALALLPALALTNEACDLLKVWTGRERPCVALNIEALTGKLVSGSFPSAHAANMAALVGLLFAVMDKRWGLAFLWLPFVVGLSRVYVGVHYPLDVFGGWLIGGLFGFGTGYFLQKWLQHRRQKSIINKVNYQQEVSTHD